MSKPRGLTVNTLKLYHGMHKASPSQLLVLPGRRPDFFQKRKEKELFSNINSFFPLVPDHYLMTSGLCDRIRSLQILFTLGPNTTQQRHSSASSSDLWLASSYANCESHQTGRLGPEALVTFPLSSFVYATMPFKGNTLWFRIKCPLCLHTKLFPHVPLLFCPDQRTDVLITLGSLLHCTSPQQWLLTIVLI